MTAEFLPVSECDTPATLWESGKSPDVLSVFYLTDNVLSDIYVDISSDVLSDSVIVCKGAFYLAVYALFIHAYYRISL